MRLIDADALNAAMYHEAFETDTDMQKWDSGCWIRYKMFERAIKAAPTIEAELEKRNEPIEPIKPEELWICGACGEGTVGWDDWIDDDTRYNYCPICGRAVKWNA